jgi:hypothetical protein
MKKLTILFLILLCLSFNIFRIAALGALLLKEGLYKASNYNLSPDTAYTAQNVSSKDDVYMLILDDNNVVQQSLRLIPKSAKYNLSPIQPGSSIVIVGGGEVSIS